MEPEMTDELAQILVYHFGSILISIVLLLCTLIIRNKIMTLKINSFPAQAQQTTPKKEHKKDDKEKEAMKEKIIKLEKELEDLHKIKAILTPQTTPESKKTQEETKPEQPQKPKTTRKRKPKPELTPQENSEPTATDEPDSLETLARGKK